MDDAEATVRQDQFVCRLLGAVAFGIAFLTAAYGAYFAFLRGPTLREMLQDFDKPLSATSRIALSSPGIPMAAAVVALVSAGLAWHRPRRWSLIGAYVLTFVALALTMAAEVAARWPAERLFRSISG